MARVFLDLRTRAAVEAGDSSLSARQNVAMPVVSLHASRHCGLLHQGNLVNWPSWISCALILRGPPRFACRSRSHRRLAHTQDRSSECFSIECTDRGFGLATPHLQIATVITPASGGSGDHPNRRNGSVSTKQRSDVFFSRIFPKVFNKDKYGLGLPPEDGGVHGDSICRLLSTVAGSRFETNLRRRLSTA